MQPVRRLFLRSLDPDGKGWYSREALAKAVKNILPSLMNASRSFENRSPRLTPGEPRPDQPFADGTLHTDINASGRGGEDEDERTGGGIAEPNSAGISESKTLGFPREREQRSPSRVLVESRFRNGNSGSGGGGGGGGGCVGGGGNSGGGSGSGGVGGSGNGGGGGSGGGSICSGGSSGGGDGSMGGGGSGVGGDGGGGGGGGSGGSGGVITNAEEGAMRESSLLLVETEDDAADVEKVGSVVSRGVVCLLK